MNLLGSGHARGVGVVGLIFGLVAALPVPGRDWSYAKWEHIEILSHCPERDSREVFESVYYFPWMLKQMFPKLKVIDKWPLRIVVTPSEKEFRSLYRREQQRLTAAGYFTQTPNYDLIVIHYDQDYQEYGRQLVFHEYAHRCQKDFLLPTWAEEGFAGIFENLHLGEGEISFGRPDSHSVAFLRQHGLVPMEILFSTPEVHTADAKEDFVSQFYAQSWLLVHYFLLAAPEDEREAFHRFLRSPESRVVNEETFRNFFGFGYEDLQARLERYTRQSHYSYLKLTMEAVPKAEQITFRRADDDVVAAFKAGAMIHAGKLEEASRELMPWLLRDDPSIRVMEDAAIYYLRMGSDQGIELARRSETQGSSAPGVMLLLLEEDLKGLNPTSSPRLTVSQMNTQIGRIKRVLTSDPNHPRAWYRFLEVWAYADTPVKPETVDSLNYALTKNPHRPVAQLLFLASVSRCEERRAEGLAMLETFIATTPNIRERGMAESIRAHCYGIAPERPASRVPRKPGAGRG